MQRIATGALAAALRRQPASPARTAFAWSIAVGPALARATSIETRDRILYVTPKDANWTRELERASSTVLARLQALLGQEIAELRVLPPPRVQSPSSLFPTKR